MGDAALLPLALHAPALLFAVDFVRRTNFGLAIPIIYPCQRGTLAGRSGRTRIKQRLCPPSILNA
jgi:hypothetical protein